MATTLQQDEIRPLEYRSKTRALSGGLLDVARRLGPGGKFPTMQHMCEQFQVSMVTLDRALHQLEEKNVICRKHGVGVFVSPRLNQRRIGLVYGYDFLQTGSSFFARMLVEHAQTRSASKNERFRFFLDVASAKKDAPTHQDLLEDIRSQRLSGIIFAGVEGAHRLDWIRDLQVPVVALSSRAAISYRVTIDFEELIQQGVRALASQGCRRIALLDGMTEDAEARTGRVAAFREAMARVGLEAVPEFIWHSPVSPAAVFPQGELLEQLGEQAIRELFAKDVAARAGRREAPDGLVIADDMMTRGAVTALRELRLRVGRDVKVATHANRGSPALRTCASDMILIEVDPGEVVDALFEMLETLMDGETPREPVVSIRPRRSGSGEDGASPSQDENQDVDMPAPDARAEAKENS